MNLRLKLFLLLPGASNAIRAETENLSTEGFFCRCTQVFPPGAHLQFVLVLPGAAGKRQAENFMYLKGTVEVIHAVAYASSSEFGIGCQLRSYSVLANSDLWVTEELLPTVTGGDHSGAHPRPPAPASLEDVPG